MNSMEVQKLFIATKAFVVKGGKVLIVRESSKYDEGTNAAKFDVVGGRLKPGERFDENLRREVKEETGLDIQIGKPFFVNEWRPVMRVKGERREESRAKGGSEGTPPGSLCVGDYSEPGVLKAQVAGATEQWQIVGIFFECDAKEGGVVLGKDHDAFEWIRPEDYVQRTISAHRKSSSRVRGVP
jgi:8-oxo-dGTP diphosphatase